MVTTEAGTKGKGLSATKESKHAKPDEKSGLNKIITLTSKEVAWLFGIDNTTLECWVTNKVLTPCSTTPVGEKRFLREDIADLLVSFGA